MCASIQVARCPIIYSRPPILIVLSILSKTGLGSKAFTSQGVICFGVDIKYITSQRFNL